MVLDFAKIVPFIQSKITEKMNYFDLLEMEMSSRRGKEAVEYITIMPVVKTKRMYFGSRNGYIHFNLPGFGDIEREFTSLSEAKNPPRFIITEVKVKSNATFECINHSIINDPLRFLDNDVELSFDCEGPEKSIIMEKMVVLFNIVELFLSSSCVSDRYFMSLPIFRMIQRISIMGNQPIPDDILLSFNAAYIAIGTTTSFPDMGPTLRTFFQEHFHNRRQIKVLDMMLPTNQKISCEELFTGLDFKLLWSYETHETSDFADIPKETLPHGIEDSECYLITGGRKKLFVFKADFMFNVRPTLNEKAEVLFNLKSNPWG